MRVAGSQQQYSGGQRQQEGRNVLAQAGHSACSSALAVMTVPRSAAHPLGCP